MYDGGKKDTRCEASQGKTVASQVTKLQVRIIALLLVPLALVLLRARPGKG